jgi:hypothetical protein
LRRHSIDPKVSGQQRFSKTDGDDAPLAKANSRARKVRNPWRHWLKDFGRALLCELLAKVVFEKAPLLLSLLAFLVLSSWAPPPEPAPPALKWRLGVVNLGQFGRDDLIEMLSPLTWLDDALRTELYPEVLPPDHNHRPNG